MTNDSRCTCPWTEPSTWTTYGDATEPGSQREFDPYCPEHGMVQPPHPTKWTVHVQGPDDLHYYDDEAAAREAAQSVNDWQARQPRDEFTPTLHAVVIPPESVAVRYSEDGNHR